MAINKKNEEQKTRLFTPILAYRLRADVLKRGPCYDGKKHPHRIWDCMELLVWDPEYYEDKSLAIMTLFHEDAAPENDTDLDETTFLSMTAGLDRQKWI